MNINYMQLPRLLRGCAAAFVAAFGSSAALASSDFASFEKFSLTAKPDLVGSDAKYASTAVDDWHLVLRLGVWAMSVDGDLSAGDRDADFSMDFSDLLDDMNFAFMPGMEMTKGKWVVAFNGLVAQLEDSHSQSRTTIGGNDIEGGADVEMDLYIADVGVGYRLFDLPMGDEDSVLSLAPAVGIRYTYFDLSINPDNFDTVSSDTELWDPYVGGRINWQFNRSLAWRTDASVGGFGVGSQFAWTAQTFLDWRFSKHFELNVGYRAMYYDYENGDRELDLTFHGPWIGLSIYLK